jgi:TRAP-type C4-dicarboxylate transport system substrate-binding protein
MSVGLLRWGFVRAAVLAAMLLTTGPASAAGQVISVGTLVPKASPWGQVLELWAKAVSEKSGGALTLKLFWSGTQGDEAAMVGKMKAGQLDVAVMSGTGLGKIYKPILALEMPGLFTTWAKLDAARDSMKSDFESGAKSAGFSLLGWTDFGAVHRMSKGLSVKTPADVKGQKPFQWRDRDDEPIFYQVIGGVTPVPLNIPEVLPNLKQGAVNIVSAPALLAEQYQWSSNLDSIDADVSAMAIGGIVISSKRLESLSEAQRTVLVETGKIAASAMQKRTRSEDDKALARLKAKMTTVTHSSDDRAKWDATYQQTRQRLAQGTFSPDLVSKLETLAK